MPGLHLFQRAHRLDQKEVHAAGGQRRGLFGKSRPRVGRGQRPQRLEQLSGRADVAGHQHRMAGRVRHGSRERGPRAVELRHATCLAMPIQPVARAAEGVSGDHLRARVHVGLIDPADHVGALDVPGLGRARLQSGRVQHRAHRTVTQDKGPCAQELDQLVHAILPLMRRRQRMSRLAFEGCATSS